MSSTDPVRMWLVALGSLTLVGSALAPGEAETRINAYAPLLAKEFDRHVFNPASLAAVARQCKYFPAYGELCEALATWHRNNAPYEREQIAAPQREHDAWSTRVRAEHDEAQSSWSDPRTVLAALQSLEGHPMRGYLGGLLSSMALKFGGREIVALVPQELWSPYVREQIRE